MVFPPGGLTVEEEKALRETEASIDAKLSEMGVCDVGGIGGSHPDMTDRAFRALFQMYRDAGYEVGPSPGALANSFTRITNTPRVQKR